LSEEALLIEREAKRIQQQAYRKRQALDAKEMNDNARRQRLANYQKNCQYSCYNIYNILWV